MEFYVLELVMFLGGAYLVSAHVKFRRGTVRPPQYYDPYAPMFFRNIGFLVTPAAAMFIFCFFLLLVDRWWVDVGVGLGLYVSTTILFLLLGALAYLSNKPAPELLKPAWLKREEAAHQ